MDLLGREVYLYPFWLERNLKEQDESLPETVYDDFYTRQAVEEGREFPHPVYRSGVKSFLVIIYC